MLEVKFSCPTLLVSMRVWPDGKSSATERKSGYQDICIILPLLKSLPFQRTFMYSRAVSSKCLVKEANPKSLSRYFLPKTIRSSPINFHS